MISELVGGILVAGVLVQVGFMSVENFRRMVGQRRQADLHLEVLKTELAMLRDLQRKRAEGALPWNGYRKFLVTRKVMECCDVCSFYLAPHDKKPLPDFLPGQYLTFRINIAASGNPVIRCYTISDAPHGDTYRVTIKRIPPRDDGGPPGIASAFFHDQIQEGDILDVKAPAGQFYLDPAGGLPVVLIGSGIGVTPVLAMLNTLITQESRREIWFFHGVRNRAEHMMREHLETIARENPNVRLNVCCSRSDPDYKLGRDYHYEGRISIDLLKRMLPSSNFDFYICGPGSMMQDIIEGLKEWGVPDANIHYETFGPSSVKKVAAATTPGTAAPVAFAVHFKRSGKTVSWSDEHGSLLELAEAHGVNIPCGCRAGSCGTCQVAVFSGEVALVANSDVETNPGTHLTCIGAPKSDLVLDA
jgi:ferredoxin-NADP reductase